MSDVMRPISWSVLLMLALTTACSSMPKSSQSGKVHQIVIGEDLSPKKLTVEPGDEVRWVNQQEGPVHIVFLDPIDGRATCSRGFGLAGVVNGRRIGAKRALSVCFGDSGSVRYTIRLDTPMPDGEMNVLGEIEIQPPQAS